MTRFRIIPAAALLSLTVIAAHAQEQSVEDRLRDALRHVTTDLRTAQDSQAALQAALDQSKKQQDLLQQQVAALTARLAAQPQAPAPAAAPAAPAQPAADTQALRQAVDTLKKQNAALQDGLGHWQSAYQQAASLAQSKDAQGRQASVAASTAERTLGVCQTKNTKLMGVADDILHLYETPRFRSLARDRWDAVLGFKRVELENIVQDNEDRIVDQKYTPGEQPAPTHPGAARGATP